MNSTEEEIRNLIFAECRALEFTARRWADARITGAYKSLQKGSGIEFEESRLYAPGDDARRIDWKVSARKQQSYVKSFREERDQSLMLLVDVSASSLLGLSQPKIKKISEICAFLTSIAIFNRDAVGAIPFDNDILTYTPPQKGLGATWRLLHSILQHAFRSPDKVEDSNKIAALPRQATDLGIALRSSSKLLKRKSLVFIISDFNFPLDFESSLQLISRKHDVFAIRIKDSIEDSLPSKGSFSFIDPETKETSLINFSSKATREKIKENIEQHSSGLVNLFGRNGVPFLHFSDQDDIRGPLFSFFQSRKTRHAR